MPPIGRTTETNSHRPMMPKRDELALRPSLQRGNARALAAERGIAAALRSSRRWHHTSGSVMSEEHDGDHSHQLIGRHAEQRRQLVDVGRQHHDAVWIAEHQRHAEGLEAEQEIERCGEHDRGQHHRKRDVT